MTEDYSWWGDFLEARTRALHAMKRRGSSMEEIVRTLNFGDLSHAERVFEATKGKPEYSQPNGQTVEALCNYDGEPVSKCRVERCRRACQCPYAGRQP